MDVMSCTQEIIVLLKAVYVLALQISGAVVNDLNLL